MKIFIRMFAAFLILTFTLYTFVCVIAPTVTCAAEEKVTQFKPETMESDPVAPPQTESKSGSSWWKWALGILVVGGVAAAAGGGHGGDSGSSSGSSGGNGSVNVGW